MRPSPLALYVLVIVAAWLPTAALAQPRAQVSFATFEAERRPYLEVYLTAERASLSRGEDGRRAVDVLLTLEPAGGPADTLALADRVTMWSPATDTVANFMEALRYSVPTGEYVLRLTLSDPHAGSGTLPLKLATPVTVRAPSSGLRLSDVQLVASRTPAAEATAASTLVKGGYVLEPLAGNLVRRQMSGTSAYVEVYPAQPATASPAVLEHTLSRITDAGTTEDLLRKTVRLRDLRATTPVFLSYNTESLESGRYLLTVTLRDRALQELDRRLATFFVANPEADALAAAAVGPADTAFVDAIPADSLAYVLLSLIPVTEGGEQAVVQGAVRSDDEAIQRRTILNHFVAMAPRPSAAGDTYRAYMRVVREVDLAFRSGFGRGFQTDRGHIWLKYGQPDDRIEVNNDPSAPPYEIWVYNYVERTQQTPGKFLFYNPSLDNANYVMLHSTVRGEIRDPRWRRELYSKTIGEFGDEDTAQGFDVGDNVGRYADQYFNDN